MSDIFYKTLCAKLMQSDSTTPLGLCCLCMNNVGEDGSSIDDDVFLNLDFGGEMLVTKISSILECLINGESFLEVMHMLKAVCKQCLNTAIAGYKLIQTCKMNTEIFNNAVAYFEQSLSDLPPTMYNCKSLYIAINPKEISKKSIIKRYFDKKQHFIPQDTAFPRFQKILDHLYPTAKICCRTDIETKDMLYNPNKPTEYKCVLCQEIFASSTGLRIHFFRQHHHSKDVKCKECYEVSDQMIFDADVQDEDVNTQLQQDTFPFEVPFEVQQSPENEPFQNDIDFYDSVDTPTVQSEVIATTHEDNNQVKRTYKCPTCKLEFEDLYWYNKHRQTLSRCKLMRGHFICDHCDRSFTQKQSLTRHILGRHMGGGLPCEYCGNRFMGLSALERHMKKHTKEKSALCLECGKSFVAEHYLQYHMNIHTGARPFQCEICEKTFTHPQTLKQHIKTHESLKVECIYCNNMIKQSFMKKHILRSHFPNPRSEQKTYSCKQCNTGKVFTSSYELRKHVKRSHKKPSYIDKVKTESVAL